MTSKKPTIDDVARRSGVARVTVSRVLNGGPNVRDEVRAKVMQAVAALDYKVNPQARTLAGGASRLLALLFASDLEAEPNSFYQSALELGALRGCVALGYQLLTHHIPEQSADRIRQIVDVIATQRCDGLILTPPFSDDVDLISEILRLKCKVVAISAGGAGRALVDSIGIDDEKGGYDIARHLLALGHRRFALIAGIAGHLSADQRHDGLMRALAETGLGAEAVVWKRGDFTFRSGVELASGLFDDPLGPTALICANDDMAAGALSAAHARGIVVPEQLSITGFDDTPVSAIVWPPLTTVHQPLKIMGERAVRRLVHSLTNGGAGADEPLGRFERLDHRVVVRGSTSAV
ncbi:MAG: transcriptional regulator, LacI family [Caulobacter sp.]|nr:transcriptional regulator, LacI family [Caulobacter sp.]